MEVIDRVILDSRSRLPDFLRNIGGASAHNSRKMTARWTISSEEMTHIPGVDIESEICAALCTEAWAENLCSLLDSAKEQAKVAKHFDQIEGLGGMTDYLSAVFDVAESFGRSTIVVSPTSLTMLMASPSDFFKKFDDIETSSMLCAVGTLKGHEVRLNQYWSDDEPALVCGKDWFTYSAGDVLRAERLTDLQTGEEVVTLHSDVKFTIQLGRIYAVTHNPSGIRFY